MRSVVSLAFLLLCILSVFAAPAEKKSTSVQSVPNEIKNDLEAELRASAGEGEKNIDKTGEEYELKIAEYLKENPLLANIIERKLMVNEDVEEEQNFNGDKDARVVAKKRVPEFTM